MFISPPCICLYFIDIIKKFYLQLTNTVICTRRPELLETTGSAARSDLILYTERIIHAVTFSTSKSNTGTGNILKLWVNFSCMRKRKQELIKTQNYFHVEFSHFSLEAINTYTYLYVERIPFVSSLNL